MRKPHVTTGDAPLVAREEELGRILSVLDLVQLGASQVVLVQGEAGVGKSRLAREVAARARTAQTRAFLGRCFDEYTAIPFFPFAELFAAMLAAAGPELQAQAPARWPELAHIVPDLTARRGAISHENQLQVFRAATAFVRAVAERHPVVLVLDDLHWADSTSLALLLYLGRNLHAAPVLILATYRAGEAARRPAFEATLRELIRERRAEELDLAALPETGTAALIQSRLGEKSVPDQVISMVHARAQGNPFFTEELLAAFIDNGVVSTGAPDLRFDGLHAFKLTRGIQSVVRERVGCLPHDAQELMSLASVLGQEFDLDVLVATSGGPEVAVLTALDGALDARMLEERPAVRGERYGFAHALIQEVLYEQLHAHRRRRLHLRVAEVLEKLRGDEPAAAAGLAAHFLRGGDMDRAQIYALRAGDDAAGRYAHAEAASHYGTALELLRGRVAASAAAEVQRRLAAELHDLNRLPEAVAAYAAALVEFERLDDRSGQALAHWGLGRVADSRYDMVTADHHLEEALRLWPDESEDAGLAHLLADAARAKTFRGNSAAAISLAERGLEVAERLGDAGLLARALLGLVTAREGMVDIPLIQLLDRAEGMARTAGDWRTLTRIYSSRAVKRFHIGALTGALDDRRRSIEAAERSAESPRVAFTYEAYANDSMMVGAWTEGREAARAALALQREGEAGAYLPTLDLAWMEGRYEDAVGLSRSMVSDARARGDLQGVTGGFASIADFELELGRPAEAEGPAREAVAVAGSGWPSELGGCVVILAETLAALDAPDTQSILADAQRVMDELGKDAWRPQLLRARGLWLMQRGDATGAIAELEASAAIARSQQSAIQLGRTLAVLADAARQQGDAESAARSEAELASVAERVGPEVRGLAWARSLPPARPRVDRPAAGTGGLSPRERQVVALIAQGFTDRQIAERLVITEGTAGVHVGHILNKLGFHGRTEIALWAVRNGLADRPQEV